MAHRTPSPGSGRLTAVLDPWAPRPVPGVSAPAADDSPTEPIPVPVPVELVREGRPLTLSVVLAAD